MIRIINCYLDDFLQQLKNRKVICFGAGQDFFDICEVFHLAPKLRYVVDNYKCGTTIKINGIQVPVVSLNEIGGEIQDDILLITTLKYAKEVILQLDRIPLCDEESFYVPRLFIGETDQMVFDDSKTQIIPKTIHYCWFGDNPMPKHFQDNIDTWQRCCPDYEIVRWDESNYDITKNRYMKQAYEEKKWGFVPDYARLDIINQHGGIYLDTDVKLLRSLDDLLIFNMFCGFENNSYVAFGLGFGACKNHRILKTMLNEYNQMEFRRGDGTLNLTASPKYQTRTLEKYGLKRNGHIQIYDEFVVLSSEYFAPINEYGFGNPTKNSFSIHQYAATWFNSEQQKGRERFIENYRYIMNRLNFE